MSVYFVASAAGAIKIGFSTEAEKRVRALQTVTHEPLEVLLIADGSRHHERHAHRMLSQYRLRGEWFLDCLEVREYIDRVRGGDWGGYVSERIQTHTDFTQDCMVAAQFIAKCGTFAGFNGVTERDLEDRFYKYWGISRDTIFKFLYRAKEPQMGEYNRLLRAVAVAAAYTKSLVDESADRAQAILDAQAEAFSRTKAIEAKVAELERQLVAASEDEGTA